jgi:type IX secretion system PorP/SprF family membrane protein
MRTRLFTCLLLLGGLCGAQQSKGQSIGTSQGLLDPSGTQYFQNQYLANPAMAGLDTGLHVNASYRHQWSGVDGSPVTEFFTADYKLGDRVGVGAHLFSDKAGLLNRTRAGLTYAYRIPLGTNQQQLSFGLSADLNFQHLNMKSLDGDQGDPSIGLFNRRENYFEAEFGVAYTDTHWSIQAALPNVRSAFTGSDKGIDGGNVFLTSASYRFMMEGDALTSIEPKLVYRGVRGFDNILDAGVNVSFLNNVLSVMGMYHTSKSVTAGMSVNIAKTIAIQALYSTQTGGIRSYVDGTYEIGATINLFK